MRELGSLLGEETRLALIVLSENLNNGLKLS